MIIWFDKVNKDVKIQSKCTTEKVITVGGGALGGVKSLGIVVGTVMNSWLADKVSKAKRAERSRRIILKLEGVIPMGLSECPDCEGTGRIARKKCRRCGGSGSIYYEECFYCGGSGCVECDCTGEIKGAADDDCLACGGSGSHTCPECSGLGKIEESV